MPTDDVIKDLIDKQIVNDESFNPGYKKGQAPKLSSLENLDPFGVIGQVPPSGLGDYDFNSLPPDKAQDFFAKINMAGQSGDLPKTLPLPGSLGLDSLAPKPLSNGIPPLQHSVWVGNPLNGEIEKQKKFMDALAKNKKDNPDWTVVLWSDQPRDKINTAPPDSTLGKMRQWAADNGVVLASIDEVFGGNNKMGLHEICKLEQNKSGTGRAAASDIVRLEVLKRFGGMYVDGDKAVNVKLDDITLASSKNKMRVLVPQDRVGTHKVLDAETDKEKEALKNGMKVVEVSGFGAGNEKNRYQNCALCATKGNLATERVLDRIKENYQKDRHELQNVVGFSTSNVDEVERAQRVEVITRTGPSAVRDTVDPGSKGVGLLPDGSVNTYTGTTSWTGEKTFTGGTDPKSFKGKMGDLPTPHALQNQAKSAATLPPKLPSVDTLTDESRTRIANAVKKSVTSLSYTIPNEMGRLDMNHIKPHLAGLSPEEQQLALHATMQTLARPEFKGLSDQVKTLKLPKDLAVSEETLDLMNNGVALKNLKLKEFTVQEAAIEGNMQFLRYANDKGLLNDLSVKTSQRLDGGSFNNVGQGGKVDVVEAAIMSGNRNAIQYLSSLPSFKTYPNIDAAITRAAKYGQIDTALALAEAHDRPGSIKQVLENCPGGMGAEVLARYRGTFGDKPEFKNLSGMLIKGAIIDNATDTIPKLQEFGVSMDHCSAAEKTEIVGALTMRSTDGPKTEALTKLAGKLGVEDELLMKAGQGDKPEIISAYLNKSRPDDKKIAFGTHDPEAALAVAHAKFPNSEVGKNDYKNVDVTKLSASEARELVQKAMVYSHDRIRAGENGDKSRVQGWNKLLESMKTAPNLQNDPQLQSLVSQTRVQLGSMNLKTPSVRDQLQQTAQTTPSPDLSQRQATSVGGKIREIFKPSAAPQKSPDDHAFVPGKGMKKM